MVGNCENGCTITYLLVNVADWSQTAKEGTVSQILSTRLKKIVFFVVYHAILMSLNA